MSEHLVSYADAAEALGVKYGTFKRWVHEGLPVQRMGSVRKVNMSDAKQWVANNPRLRAARPTSVYFGRKDGMIKIGFAVDVERRATELGIEVITFIPGGKPLELLFHKRFEYCRIEGEWYHPSDELIAVIECVARGHDD